jgi:hypothetical protein
MQGFNPHKRDGFTIKGTIQTIEVTNQRLGRQKLQEINTIPHTFQPEKREIPFGAPHNTSLTEREMHLSAQTPPLNIIKNDLKGVWQNAMVVTHENITA